jgi:uncharacterized Zn finger protein
MICLSDITDLVTCPTCAEPQVGAEVVGDDTGEEYWVCAACGECTLRD